MLMGRHPVYGDCIATGPILGPVHQLSSGDIHPACMRIDELNAKNQITVVAVAGHNVQLHLEAELVGRVALAGGEVQRRAHSAQGGDPVPITGVQSASAVLSTIRWCL
jgi:hypothetical protein